MHTRKIISLSQQGLVLTVKKGFFLPLIDLSGMLGTLVVPYLLIELAEYSVSSRISCGACKLPRHPDYKKNYFSQEGMPFYVQKHVSNFVMIMKRFRIFNFPIKV